MHPDTLLVPYYPGYKVDSLRDGHVYGICVLNFKTDSTKLGEYFFFFSTKSAMNCVVPKFGLVFIVQ